MRRLLLSLSLFPVFFACVPAMADVAQLPLITSTSVPTGTTTYSASMTTLLAMGLWGLVVPAILCLTPFLRITIVFSIMRQALGLTSIPSNKVLAALAFIVSCFIMSPQITKIYNTAWIPLQKNEITVDQAAGNAWKPIREFMIHQTRAKYLEAYLHMNGEQYTTKDKVSVPVLAAAYISSEIQTALTIGFFIYIPSVIIDLIVSSVLMALGMMMVSPMIISTPIKILVFVLCDGWMLIVEGLSKSFFMGGS
ncbi:flagellar type III secretion system pore protein FliP [Photobacterium damselae]|uniref:flagellar type III secretion system pore protein FliP n=2 Tax=Photobacterium damselae TaxID=38293 RepID=UPI001F452FFC|nr:flagellar type III secretion system pore protein FliP [Photobacterium damselae]UKA04629.1 flagellar type III secretion system pore protein FliP [Photobacterium damselae subsp. damselae]